MASDSAATYSDSRAETIEQQHVTKIHEIERAILFSSSGSFGIAHLLEDQIRRKWLNEYKKGEVTAAEFMGGVSKLHHDTLQHLFHSAAMLGQAGHRNAFASVTCVCLVALPVLGEPCLFQSDETGSPHQATHDLPFLALGAGQGIADPFLAFMKKILWTGAPATLAEARLVAAWTIKHVVETNPGGVGGKIQLATLSMRGRKPEIEFSDPDEHEQ
jgi:20S proteasome alpha/beta subunit